MISPLELRVAAITTGRQDYGILRSTVRRSREARRFALELWVGGMHLSPRFGAPLELLTSDGVTPDVTLPFLAEPPVPSEDASRALHAFARALNERRPDAVLLVGDRSETLAAGVAATLERTPIIHLHGGEETEGAIDNALRHALTKLSHLHLVTHPEYARRVRQMGEDPSNIVIVGVPGADNLWRDDLPDRAALERALGCTLASPLVIVTVHPTTLGAPALEEVTAVSAALDAVEATYVVTQPNADRDSEVIREFWRTWGTNRARTRIVDALGEHRYWGLLRLASAVVGNSSSGILEAPAAGVPVVNVGDRQRGRVRSGSVRDVPVDATRIAGALRDALQEGRSAAASSAGPAAPRIVDAIAEWLPRRTVRKVFHPLPSPEAAIADRPRAR